jgi:hypothetical protein
MSLQLLLLTELLVLLLLAELLLLELHL